MARQVVVAMTDKEMLKEILACQNCVEDNQYTPEEKVILQKLMEKGYVVLAWCVTPKGKNYDRI